MLVIVNRATGTHATLKAAGLFCINLLGRSHLDHLKHFSSPAHREARFSTPDWEEDHDLDYLSETTAIFCRTSNTMVVGTHEIFVGEVFDIKLASEPRPIGWMNGQVHEMSPF